MMRVHTKKFVEKLSLICQVEVADPVVRGAAVPQASLIIGKEFSEGVF